jgi:hypothetical protein
LDTPVAEVAQLNSMALNGGYKLDLRATLCLGGGLVEHLRDSALLLHEAARLLQPGERSYPQVWAGRRHRAPVSSPKMLENERDREPTLLCLRSVQYVRLGVKKAISYQVIRSVIAHFRSKV